MKRIQYRAASQAQQHKLFCVCVWWGVNQKNPSYSSSPQKGWFLHPFHTHIVLIIFRHVHIWKDCLPIRKTPSGLCCRLVPNPRHLCTVFHSPLPQPQIRFFWAGSPNLLSTIVFTLPLLADRFPPKLIATAAFSTTENKLSNRCVQCKTSGALRLEQGRPSRGTGEFLKATEPHLLHYQ